MRSAGVIGGLRGGGASRRAVLSLSMLVHLGKHPSTPPTTQPPTTPPQQRCHLAVVLGRRGDGEVLHLHGPVVPGPRRGRRRLRRGLVWPGVLAGEEREWRGAAVAARHGRGVGRARAVRCARVDGMLTPPTHPDRSRSLSHPPQSWGTDWGEGGYIRLAKGASYNPHGQVRGGIGRTGGHAAGACVRGRVTPYLGAHEGAAFRLTPSLPAIPPNPTPPPLLRLQCGVQIDNQVRTAPLRRRGGARSACGLRGSVRPPLSPFSRRPRALTSRTRLRPLHAPRTAVRRHLSWHGLRRATYVANPQATPGAWRTDSNADQTKAKMQVQDPDAYYTHMRVRARGQAGGAVRLHAHASSRGCPRAAPVSAAPAALAVGASSAPRNSQAGTADGGSPPPCARRS